MMVHSKVLSVILSLLVMVAMLPGRGEPAPAPATSTPSSGPPLTQVRVVFFFIPRAANDADRVTIGPLCEDLGFSFEVRSYKFVNDEEQWFDKGGKRKFDVLIIPGGDPPKWFEKSSGSGIDATGCQNIRKFISTGGSVISICHSGPSVFAKTHILIAQKQVQAHPGVKWAPFVYDHPGFMVMYYGGAPIFKGDVRGPQESNMPYPRIRFLPIKLNKGNPIIEKAALPDTLHLSVVGGGSLIPDRDQTMEVIGWFPNGTVAIGVVRYGDGHLYMVAPHPSITLENSGAFMKRLVSGPYARAWGVTEEQVSEALSILDREGDPDGPAPDLTLMKAILKDAAARASATVR